MKKSLLKRSVAMALSASFFFLPTNSEAAVSTYAQLGQNIPIVAEFKNTSLVDTLDALSKLSDIPIVIHGQLSTETVTLNSNGQSLATIMDNLSRAFNLSYVEQNGMIVVSKKDIMTTTETFKLKYLDLSEILDDLKTFVDEDDVSVSASDNSVTISGSAADIARARQLIEAKDVKQKQVSISAKLVELDKDDVVKLGLNHTWTPLHTTDYSWDKGWNQFRFATGLTAEETESTGKVLARPTVSAMNGREASIMIGDRVPILTTTTSDGDRTTTVSYENVGVNLKVTPRINEDTGFVTLSLNPSVSTITGYVANDNVNAPQIATREVNTTLRVKSGETVVIGGLLKKDDLMSLFKIPILGDLPILGKLLFQYKNHTQEETELVIMVTPVIEGADEFDPNIIKSEDRMHNIHNQEAMDRVHNTDRRGRDIHTDDSVEPKDYFYKEDKKDKARQKHEEEVLNKLRKNRK